MRNCNVIDLYSKSYLALSLFYIKSQHCSVKQIKNKKGQRQQENKAWQRTGTLASNDQKEKYYRWVQISNEEKYSKNSTSRNKTKIKKKIPTKKNIYFCLFTLSSYLKVTVD
ncbi:hypothetical protein CISIN_1g035664mg [Citrus sinensis]|uniref:Uncharacterized protein n=1 Tax=Citrus sinensis TaxID=2711 RepID=A0A067FSW8_CITSI|nr:hypothetical protein CISIN_1g035664mg [Citrus sinensis]